MTNDGPSRLRELHADRKQSREEPRREAEHLPAGDPASNSLGWHSLAGSFDSRPCTLNRENLERSGGDRYGQDCPRAAAADFAAPGSCPFEAPVASATPAEGPRAHLRDPEAWPPATGTAAVNVPRTPALRSHPARPALFLCKAEPIAGPTATSGGQDADASPLNLKRPAFLCERLLGLPVQGLEPNPFLPLTETLDSRLDPGRISRWWQQAEPAQGRCTEG